MINSSIEQKLNNFSKLPDQDCAYVLQTYFLEALEMEDPTYLEWEVLAKFIDVDYELREPLCKLFNYSLKRNTQEISGIPINVWLKQYLDKYARIPREPDTFLRYTNSNPEIQKLNEKDQIRLMRIFRLYDYLFVEPVPDLDSPQAVNLMRFPMYLSKPLQEILTEMSSARTEGMPSSQTASEKLAVKEALRKFPNLGEQSVTMNPIKLKQFDHPVRPSVRNWLYDYTMQLGQTGHSSMDRTNYLFRNDNAKNLSSPERDKLAIILKSFDENALLPVDGKRQEIVFESFTRKEAPPQRIFPTEPRPAASINFIRPAERPSAPVQRNISSAPKQQFFPVQRQENSFVRYYSKPEIQKTQKVDQGSSAPPKVQLFSPAAREQQDSSKSNLQPPDKMEFTNPYPKPGTHETQLEKSDDNISNIRFSEGAPKDYFTSISQVSAKKIPTDDSSPSPTIPARPLDPVQKSAPASPTPAPSAYRFTPPNKNIIQPHYGGEARRDKPEPKIQGNTVDLREQ